MLANGSVQRWQWSVVLAWVLASPDFMSGGCMALLLLAPVVAGFFEPGFHLKARLSREYGDCLRFLLAWPLLVPAWRSLHSRTKLTLIV